MGVYVACYGHVDCIQNGGFKILIYNMFMNNVCDPHFLWLGYLLMGRLYGYSRIKAMLEFQSHLVLHS